MDIMPMGEYKDDKAPNWSELTPEQKREERFKKWLAAPGIKLIVRKLKNFIRQG